MIKISEELAKEFIFYLKPKSLCNSGQHILDRLYLEIDQQLKEKICELCGYDGPTSVYNGKNICEQCRLGEENH